MLENLFGRETYEMFFEVLNNLQRAIIRVIIKWKYLLKNQEDGGREGAEFIRNHIIKVTDIAFDGFATIDTNPIFNRKNLGL